MRRGKDPPNRSSAKDHPNPPARDGYAAVEPPSPPASAGRGARSAGPGLGPATESGREGLVCTRSDVDARDYELTLQNNLFINDPSAKQLYSTPQMCCTGRCGGAAAGRSMHQEPPPSLQPYRAHCARPVDSLTINLRTGTPDSSAQPTGSARGLTLDRARCPCSRAPLTKQTKPHCSGAPRLAAPPAHHFIPNCFSNRPMPLPSAISIAPRWRIQGMEL